MKFFRIDLLTLLISLFILGSCKNPTGIGLPIDATQALQTNLIDSATIRTTTVYDDSVQTNNPAKSPLAFFKDPVFGTTEANIAAALNLPSLAAYTVPVSTSPAVVDSAILVLPYADGFYGDSLTTKYKVNVYQLDEPVSNSQTYYNTKVWKTRSTLYGTRTFFPRPKTGFKVTTIVTGAADTATTVAPQLRIKIDPNLVYNQIWGASTSQLNSNAVFQNYIRGLYITLDQSQTATGTSVGGTMFFNVASGMLNVYYHTTNAGVIDTVMTPFPIGTPHSVQVKHTYPTALKATLDNPPASNGTIYLQGLSGLRAKVTFPYLKKLLAAQQTATTDIVVNRAELIVTPVAGTDIPYVPTPRLTMYRNDIAAQRQLIPDAYAGDLHFIAVGSFGGFYDAYHKTYHYVITGYVEDLMRGTLVDYGTYISPSDTVGVSTGAATVSVTPAVNVAARVIVGGDKTSPYKMKLNIIYSKISK